eukprot:scaffold87649_cov18-Tisochrysis_lutea.AAC.1
MYCSITLHATLNLPSIACKQHVINTQLPCCSKFCGGCIPHATLAALGNAWMACTNFVHDSNQNSTFPTANSVSFGSVSGSDDCWVLAFCTLVDAQRNISFFTPLVRLQLAALDKDKAQVAQEVSELDVLLERMAAALASDSAAGPCLLLQAPVLLEEAMHTLAKWSESEKLDGGRELSFANRQIHLPYSVHQALLSNSSKHFLILNIVHPFAPLDILIQCNSQPLPEQKHLPPPMDIVRSYAQLSEAHSALERLLEQHISSQGHSSSDCRMAIGMLSLPVLGEGPHDLAFAARAGYFERETQGASRGQCTGRGGIVGRPHWLKTCPPSPALMFSLTHATDVQ